MEAIPRNLAPSILTRLSLTRLSLTRLSLTRLSLTRLSLGLMSLGLMLATGCKLGRNDPQIQNAFEMLRIERDAAEDQYYQAKMQQEKAQWRIEDLEEQLKQVRDDQSTVISPNDTDNPGGDSDTARSVGYDQNEYARTQVSPDSFSSDQINTSAVFVPSNEDSTVSSIEIDPNLTRGFHDRGKPGDDGTFIAFRALNRFGKPLKALGSVRISLIDPARRNIRGFVGTWDIAKEDLAEWYDTKANAFIVKLPWLRGTPKNSDLKAFVQLDEGEFVHETSADLHIVLDGQPKARWTKAPTESSITENSSPNLNDPQLADSPTINRVQNPSNTQGSIVDSVESNETRIARPKWTPYR